MASEIGDGLTVLIAESATASGTTLNSLSKKTSASGALSTGQSHSVGRGALNLASDYDGAGQSVRSDKMVASISVTVVGLASNGDLLVAGEQQLNVNGERTHIRVHGRARRVDISSANTIVSTRLADAQIDYSGAGVIGRAARPGLLTRLLTGFGAF
jgi:flagellar L-ring protein precursor FlgH